MKDESDFPDEQSILSHLEVLEAEVLKNVEDELTRLLDASGNEVRRAILAFSIRWIGTKTLATVLEERGGKALIDELTKSIGEADRMLDLVLANVAEAATQPERSN